MITTREKCRDDRQSLTLNYVKITRNNIMCSLFKNNSCAAGRTRYFMSTESRSFVDSPNFDVPHVHVFENGIIATVEPRYSNTCTLILSGPWYKFLMYGHILNDGVNVWGWEGPDGFRHHGILDFSKKTLTCILQHKEIGQDLNRLATLRMIRPYFE